MFSGQVPTTGPMTMEAFATAANEELAELYARAAQTVSAIAGSANAITGTLSPVPPSYAWARLIIFKPALANTGAVTVNWSGLGVIALKRQDGSDLANGNLDPDVYYVAVYNQSGNYYQIIGAFANPDSGYLPLTGGNLLGEVNFQDFLLTRPVIKDYALKRQAYTSVAGVLTLDFANGNVAEVTLTEDVTSIVINNWPPSTHESTMTLYTTQDATGGWEIDFDQPNWLWPNGLIPVVTLTPLKTDIYAIKSPNGGMSIFSTVGGQNYGA